MIELPRACVRADEIAAHADFFSFGTNDLTQTALGFSRDDAEGKFLTRYLEDGVLAHDPFATLDQEGVGELMRIAVERGRAANAGLTIGICGEHGGDPASVRVLPRARPRLRLLLAVPRARRPARGGAGGARRERHRPVRGVGRLGMLATALAILLAAAPGSQGKLPLRACTVQGVPARCGTLLVPENRDTGIGARIGLRVVVIPARRKPARPDAFTYLAGGPGGAATQQTAAVNSIWSGVHEGHDVLLVDQRGTGGSHPLACPPPSENPDVGVMIEACIASLNGDSTQYGSAAAADDLEAVRTALGYRSLDLYGVSYGATLAQIYLARHPRSVRTVALDGATLLDIPFWARFAINGQRALDLTAKRCAREPGCAGAFPSWPAQLRSLIASWNAKPRLVAPELTLTGDDLAGLIQYMTLTAASAASIPLVVSKAARGEYAPLTGQIPSSGADNPLMYWSIWCNERWVGLDAKGPWDTYLDGYVAAQLERYRSVCRYVPHHAEPPSSQARVRSNVPVLALVGGADPQDPAGNIAGLGAALPKARVVVVREHGHGVGQYGCLPNLVALFIERASAATLDTRCVRTISPPPFALR